MEIFLVDNSVNAMSELQSFNPLILVPFAVAALVWLFKIYLWDSKPNSKTKSIAILGRKASGKTTLWNRLRDYPFDKTYTVTAVDKVERFFIKKNDREVEILSTLDVGGGKDWVGSQYDKLIGKETFILFLVDSTSCGEEARNDIRARVLRIMNIICEKKLDNVGFSLYITHTDEYIKNNPGTTKEQVIEKIKAFLDLESVRVPEKKVQYNYTAVDLFCDEDIDLIKKDIIDLVYE